MSFHSLRGVSLEIIQLFTPLSSLGARCASPDSKKGLLQKYNFPSDARTFDMVGCVTAERGVFIKTVAVEVYQTTRRQKFDSAVASCYYTGQGHSTGSGECNSRCTGQTGVRRCNRRVHIDDNPERLKQWCVTLQYRHTIDRVKRFL